MGGQIVGAAFVIELAFLNGCQKLNDLGVSCHSLVKVD
jgi:adenine/guanine phosphoribosyltransferase-like PRPP-binding protein